MDNGNKSSSKDRMVPVNPTPFVHGLIGKEIIVRLKWGMEYRGFLKCADAYMNLLLEGVEEFIDDYYQSSMDSLLIRCNNILYIRENLHQNGKDH